MLVLRGVGVFMSEVHLKVLLHRSSVGGECTEAQGYLAHKKPPPP
jgi:hypothetical protein